MTADTAPDAWKEVCLIGIIPDGGSETQWAGMTGDITAMDFGDKDIEGMPLVNGGRVTKYTPQVDESITLKLYPTNALVGSEGAVQWFHPQDTADSSQPILVKNTRNRTKHCLILTWATQLPATAGTASVANAVSYRIQIINAYMTSYKPSFDDKTKSVEVTFKWTPFNKAGTENKREESTDGTVTLPTGNTSATAWT